MKYEPWILSMYLVLFSIIIAGLFNWKIGHGLIQSLYVIVSDRIATVTQIDLYAALVLTAGLITTASGVDQHTVEAAYRSHGRSLETHLFLRVVVTCTQVTFWLPHLARLEKELKWVFLKKSWNCWYYWFWCNETNLFTSLGSPSDPLQSDGWEIEFQTNTTIRIQHLFNNSCALSLLSLHFTHRDIQKHRYPSDFQPETCPMDKNNRHSCAPVRHRESPLCGPKRDLEREKES